MTTALITGADGFIGSHLAEALVKAGYRVKALSLYNSFGSWGWLDDVDCASEIEVLSGDVRDPQYCKTITQGVDVVFHLAALIAIPYSYVAPDSYIDTNVKGTLNMCQAARDGGVSRFIHTSTSEVYGTAQYVPIDELHPLQPQSPYSASKIAADAMAMSFLQRL
jgi:nucleoside-diphosphate-sugar epimerase